jgi:TRAP-type C4-dicarboxylate transport system permease small subunit
MRIEAAGRWLENALLVGLFAGLMLLAVAQIVLRNIGSSGLIWGDGLVRVAVLWLALLGAVAASRDQKHIAIGLAHRFLPERWRRWSLALVEAFTAVVCGYLTFHSWVFVRDSLEFGDVILGNWPAWLFQLILPVGFGLLAYRYALLCLRRVVGVLR